MAEVLRDLVVSLSLKSDNFSRNITSINKQIKEAESAFKLAGAGIDNYSKTTDGMNSRLSMLKTTLGHQKEAVTQYERALDAANKKLQESHDRQQQYQSKLAEAKQKHNEIKESIDRQKQSLQDLAAVGMKGTSVYAEEAARLDQLKAEYKASGDEVKKLEKQLAALEKTTQNAANAVTTAQTNLNNAKAAVAATEAEIKKLTAQIRIAESSWTKAGTALAGFATRLESVGKSMTKIGKTLTKYVTTPIVGLATTAVKSAMDFESSFTSVRKTVDATEEEFAQLAAASKDMSTKVAASTTQINEVMATGGQLGIANQNLTDFTKVMIDLGNSCEDLDANTAAEQLAKFANVMGTDQSLFQNIGSTVVELGNNFATTEKPIVEMAQRLAGAGKQVGLTEAQVLGVSAALSSVGIRAQMGGSAMSKALIKMEVAAETGGQALKDFAMVSGMTEKQFVETWRSDPMAVFQAFIDGLSKIDDEGASAIATLNEIGISEIRLRDTLMRATNAHEMFARAQQMATNAWQENTALSTEANKRYATLASRLTNLKNKAMLFAQTIGDDLRPTIEKVMDSVSKFIDKLNNMDASQRQNIIRFAALAAAAGPVIMLIGKLDTGLAKVVGGLGNFCTSVGKAGGGMSGLLSVLSKSPAVWLAVAAAVVYGVAKLADYVSGAKAAREAQERLNETVEKWGENVVTAFEKSKGLSAFGLSADDFKVGEGTGADDWLSQTIATWTDGKKETNKIVADTVKGFTDGTDKIRDALNTLKDTAGGDALGDLSGDLKTLDSIDKEVESILKKRQNGLLTDDDTARLQELMNQRDAIKIKYQLVEDTGSAFDQIAQGVQAALSRGADGATTYTDAFAAATQGMGAFTDSLNAEYDARYKVISAIEDEQEKEKQLGELRKWYDEQSAAAQKQYYDTLLKTAQETGVFADGGQFAETASQLETIYGLMQAAAGKDGASQEMNDLRDALAGLDESGIVEMEAAIAAMETAAAGAGETVPEEVAKAKEALEQVKEAATDTTKVFSDDVGESIKTMFSGLAEETPEVFASLNCDALSQAYDAWAAGEHADIIPSIDTESIDVSALKNLEGNVTAIHDGEEVTVDLSSLDALEGTVSVINDYGTATTVSISSLEDLQGTVTGVKGTNVTIDISSLDALTGTVTAISDDGEETTVSLASIDGLTGTVTAVYDGENVTVDMSSLDALEGTVTVIGDNGAATTVSLTSLKKLKGEVTGYTEGEGVSFDAALLKGLDGTVTTIVVSPNAELPVVELEANIGKVHPLELNATETRMNDKTGGTGGFLDNINLFESTRDTVERVNELAAAVADYTKEAEEAKKVGDTWGQELFTDAATGNAEQMRTQIESLSDLDLTNIGERIAALMGALAGGEGTPEEMAAWTEELQNLQTFVNTIDPASFNQTGTNVMEGIAQGMTTYGWSGDASAVATAIQDAVNGALGAHSPATTMIPTGSDVAEGIGEGMTTYDFSSAAGSLASKVKAAAQGQLNATTLTSVGKNAMAGLAAGISSGQNSVVTAMRQAAIAAVKAAKSALKIESPSKVFRDEVGVMVMRGFGKGIEEETEAQAKIIGNAAQYLTSAARGGIAAGGDNRRTYNNASTVNLNVAEMHVRDKQDIHSLAVELASLVKTEQRGKGLRMA